jgi:hypothetical protein
MNSTIIKKGICISFIFIVIFCLILGCKKDDNTDINGKWTGKTSQNQKISFTIDNNNITYIDISVLNTNSKMNMTFITMDEIIDNSFTSINYDMEISGKFQSKTSSNGTFKMGSITGTWTATKQ